MSSGNMSVSVCGLLCLLLCACPQLMPVSIAVSDAQHEFASSEEVWSFEVWNGSGTGARLAFAAEADQPWVTISPAGGTSTGPDDRTRISVQVDPAAYDGTAKEAAVSIMANGLPTRQVKISIPTVWQRTYPNVWEVRSNDTIQRLEPAVQGGYYALVYSDNYDGTLGAEAYSLLRLDASGGKQWSAVLPSGNYAPGILAQADGGCLVYRSSNDRSAVNFDRYTSEGIVTSVSVPGQFVPSTQCGAVHLPSGGFALIGGPSSSSVSLFTSDDALNNCSIRNVNAPVYVRGFGAAPDGGFLLAALAITSSYYYTEPLLVRTDSAGAVLWTVQLWGKRISSIGNVISMPDGTWRIAVTASTSSGDIFEILSVSDSGQLTASQDIPTGLEDVTLRAATELSDGSFVLAGVDDSGYGLAAKVDSEGNVAWLRSSAAAMSSGYATIAVGTDGNIGVAGGSDLIIPQGTAAAYSEARLDVLSQSGQIVNEQGYTMSTGQGDVYDDRATRILPLPGGGYVVAGTTRVGYYDIIGDSLLKIDDSGNAIWSDFLTGKSIDDLAVTADNRTLVLTSEDGEAGTSSILAYDSGGTASPAIVLSSAGGNTFSAILAGPDNGFVLAGAYTTTTSGYSHVTGVFVSALSETGAALWTSRLQSNVQSSPLKLVPVPDGGCVVLFQSVTSGIAYSTSVAKFDSQGGHVWTWSSGDIPSPITLAASPGGDVFVIGYRNTSSRNEPMAARVSADGGTLWLRSFSYGLLGQPSDAVVTPEGDLVVAENTYYDQNLLISISPDGEDNWLRGIARGIGCVANAHGSGLMLAGASFVNIPDVLVCRVTSNGYGVPSAGVDGVGVGIASVFPGSYAGIGAALAP